MKVLSSRRKIMAERVLNLRELNRATLARQMLLERQNLPVADAIERLVGLQAQQALPPYVGLWTRLHNFNRDSLANELESRVVVKATLIRGTLHLFTAADYLRFRKTLQPMLAGAVETIAKNRTANFDLEELLAMARQYIEEKPRTFAEISAMLTERLPDEDVGVMRYTVRTRIPLVQVPIADGWSYPNKPEFTLAESWLGQAIAPEDRLPELALRYLAAFGPASATDMQTWLGMAKLKELFEKLKPELQLYKDEGRRELFDLPDRPLPDGDTPAPVRFLPEFDNLLLSHSNRTRVIAKEHHPKVYLPGLRVAATILVDGFVSGVWQVEKNKGVATMVIEPFNKLNKKDRAALIEEGEQLIRFIEAKAKSFAVRFAES
jgi:hypothetical protein